MASVATVALAAASPAVAQNVHVLNGQTFTVVATPTTINSLNIDPGGTVNLTTNVLVVNDSGVDTLFGPDHRWHQHLSAVEAGHRDRHFL